MSNAGGLLTCSENSYFLPLWSMLVTYVVYVSVMKEELNGTYSINVQSKL